jgi:HEAT repeat protein
VPPNLTEELPILAELRELGLDVEHIEDMYQQRYDYQRAIPLLVSWIPRVQERAVKEMLVRAVSVPWARGTAGPTLVKAFEQADEYPGSFQWAVGSAIETIADPSLLDDMIRLARDKKYGRAREMVVMGLGRIRRLEAVQTLIELLDDPEVAGHAVKGLAKLQPPEARAALERFVDDERGWVKLAARRAIAGIDRKTANAS